MITTVCDLCLHLMTLNYRNLTSHAIEKSNNHYQHKQNFREVSLIFPDIHTLDFRNKQIGYHFVFQAKRFNDKTEKTAK